MYFSILSVHTTNVDFSYSNMFDKQNIFLVNITHKTEVNTYQQRTKYSFIRNKL